MRRVSLVCLVMLFLITVAAVVEGQPGIWHQLGPFEEWISALAVDPTDPEVIYAAAARGCGGGDPCGRGFLKSLDGGNTWLKPDRDGPPTNGTNFEEIVIDPEQPSTLFAFDDHEVWRSRDAGASWHSITSALVGNYFITVEGFAIGRGSVVYAASEEGELFRSEDEGETWSRGSIDPVSSPRALAVVPGDSNLLIVGGLEGLARSADQGETWELLSARTTVDIIVESGAPERLYAIRQAADETFQIERSVDSGATWTALPGAPQPGDFQSSYLAFDDSSAVLYAAVRDEVWHSADGGESWQRPVAPLAGISLRALAAGGGRAFAGFLNGIRLTEGASGVWRSSGRGLSPSWVTAMAVDPERRAVFANSIGPILTRTFDDGATWDHVEIPVSVERHRAAIFDLALEPLPSELPGTPALYAALGASGVYKSSDSGLTWERIRPEGALVAVDPRETSTVYVVGSRYDVGSRLFKSVDGGATWRAADEGLFDLFLPRSLSFPTTDPQTLYLATFNELYRSLDGATSWTAIDDFRLERLSGVVVDPRDSENVYVGGNERGARIFRSLDGGLNWERRLLTSGFPPALAIEPGSSSRERPSSVYAGTTSVFRSVDRGSSWLRLDNIVPAPTRPLLRVGELFTATDPASGHEIVYAASVNGVQRYQIPEKLRLLLREGRFSVEVEWRDFAGQSGRGRVATVATRGSGGEDAQIPLRSTDSTMLQFFSADNWEMLLKVLDGRAVNDRYWVFLAAATDIGYTVEVTDTSCGTVKSYRNNVGTASPSVTDTTAFADCTDPAPVSCVPSERTICLGEGGRFQAEVIWRNALGQRNRARQVTVPQAGFAESDDSGLFYFFSRENWELLVKVLDGCAVNGHFWVFGSATTDVEYTMTVTDEVSGQSAVYTNPLGFAADAINDTGAFATCDMN